MNKGDFIRRRDIAKHFLSLVDFYKRFSETPFRIQTADLGFPATQSVLHVAKNKRNWNHVSD